MTDIRAGIRLLSKTAQLPTQAHQSDAGWDLYSDLGDGWVPVYGGSHRSIPTGIAIECPEGYYYEIRGRSSTWSKFGLMVVSGLIDAGYQGELQAFVHNPGKDPVRVEHGQRLAQVVFHRLITAHFEVVDLFEPTPRGESGYGSSGQ